MAQISDGSPNRAGGRVQQKTKRQINPRHWQPGKAANSRMAQSKTVHVLMPNPPQRDPTNPTAHKPSRTLETRCLDAQCTCRRTHSSGAGDPPQSTAASKHRRDATAHAPNFGAHDGSNSSTHDNPASPGPTQSWRPGSDTLVSHHAAAAANPTIGANAQTACANSLGTL